MVAIDPKHVRHNKPDPTLEAVWEAYEADRGTGHRPHLGFSLLGQECERATWYVFRWARDKAFPGRMLALFERGEHEEARLVRDLRRVGVMVMDVDPDTGRQWRVSYLAGHAGGSLDGIAQGFLHAPKRMALCEFKTHNEKSFRALEKQGVRYAKPQHYDQMQSYMGLSAECLGIKLERAYYLAVNKNTDERYAEWVYYNAERAKTLLKRAERIVKSDAPPMRVSEKPDYMACKFCDFRDICHKGEAAERNCRTCVHAVVDTESGGWRCNLHGGERLTLDEQFRGCPDHRYLPGLVPGTVKSASREGNWLHYDMGGGLEWTDHGPESAQEAGPAAPEGSDTPATVEAPHGAQGDDNGD